MNENTISQNARVAAVAFPLGAILLHVLNQIDASLLPLRLIAVGILIFGVWAFSDEMGTSKPLNRAAFVSFIFAVVALLVVLLQPESPQQPYMLIYAFGLLISCLLYTSPSPRDGLLSRMPSSA